MRYPPDSSHEMRRVRRARLTRRFPIEVFTELSDVAPGFHERALQHVEHAVEEAEGQSPDDVTIGLTDEDSREAHVGHLGNRVLYLTMFFVQPLEWEPEGLLHFGWIEIEFLMLGQIESVS